MFFGRPVAPDMFFSPGGVTKFIEADTRIGLGENDAERSGFENAARVNRRLLHERFGRITTRHLEHTAAPLRKSVLLEMETEFAAEFEATAASRFRAKDNISVTNSLYHYYALLTGRAVTQELARVLYVDTTQRSGLKSLNKMLDKRNHDFFCLNDGSFPEVEAEVTEALPRGWVMITGTAALADDTGLDEPAQRRVARCRGAHGGRPSAGYDRAMIGAQQA